jgi:hypothetical protein
VKRYAVRSGNHLYLTLPGGIRQIQRLRSDHRENPLYRGRRAESQVRYEIRLPASYRDVHLAPGAVTWKGPVNLGSVRFRMAKRTMPGGRTILEIVQEANLNPAVIPADDYASLLDINRRLSHPKNRTVLVSLETSR